MSRNKFFMLLFLSITLITACGGLGSGDKAGNDNGEKIGKQILVDGGTYQDISVSELETMLENKDFLMVNVHIPFEGDLPDTDISIPYNEIGQYLDVLPEDKDAKIVLYCRSDNMSGIASEELVGLGYTNIYNLDGGFNAWKDAGLPMAGE